MKATEQDKEYALKILMQGSSLHDLLGILQNICEKLTLTNLNPKTKQFKNFQFTFFGLMARSKSILEMMVYRTEFLKQSAPEFGQIHSDLVKLQRQTQKAYGFIHSHKMSEGRKQIIECSKQYQHVFEEITTAGHRMMIP